MNKLIIGLCIILLLINGCIEYDYRIVEDCRQCNDNEFCMEAAGTFGQILLQCVIKGNSTEYNKGDD